MTITIVTNKKPNIVPTIIPVKLLLLPPYDNGLGRFFASFWSPEMEQHTKYHQIYFLPRIFKHDAQYLREFLKVAMGNKGGAVVRALASQQCGRGSNPGVDDIRRWVCSLRPILFHHLQLPIPGDQIKARENHSSSSKASKTSFIRGSVMSSFFVNWLSLR